MGVKTINFFARFFAAMYRKKPSLNPVRGLLMVTLVPAHVIKNGGVNSAISGKTTVNILSSGGGAIKQIL